MSFDEMRDLRAFGIMKIERDTNFEVKKIKDIEGLR